MQRLEQTQRLEHTLSRNDRVLRATSECAGWENANYFLLYVTKNTFKYPEETLKLFDEVREARKSTCGVNFIFVYEADHRFALYRPRPEHRLAETPEQMGDRDGPFNMKENYGGLTFKELARVWSEGSLLPEDMHKLLREQRFMQVFSCPHHPHHHVSLKVLAEMLFASPQSQRRTLYKSYGNALATTNSGKMRAHSRKQRNAEKRKVKEAVEKALDALMDGEDPNADRNASFSTKFGTTEREYELGDVATSVLGVVSFMNADEDAVKQAMAHEHGLPAIEEELRVHGTEEDKEVFEYICRGKTGDLKKEYPNGEGKARLDATGPAGRTLASFLACPQAQTAQLHLGHILALRLYTTPCFQSLNNPFRGKLSDDGKRLDTPHPFPTTIALLDEAIRRLRTTDISADGASATREVILWRGLHGVRHTQAEFQYGVEVAPMSTSHDIAIALRYSTRALFAKAAQERSEGRELTESESERAYTTGNALLLRLRTTDFSTRGPNLEFVSAFPKEREVLYPPLTRLKVSPGWERPIEVQYRNEEQRIRAKYTVFQVEPSFG